MGNHQSILSNSLYLYFVLDIGRQIARELQEEFAQFLEPRILLLKNLTNIFAAKWLLTIHVHYCFLARVVTVLKMAEVKDLQVGCVKRNLI